MAKRKLIIEHFSDTKIQKMCKGEIFPYERKWVDIFCNYPKEEKTEICLEQFKWHTFSYGKHSAVYGEEAMKIYSKQLAG